MSPARPSFVISPYSWCKLQQDHALCCMHCLLHAPSACVTIADGRACINSQFTKCHIAHKVSQLPSKGDIRRRRLNPCHLWDCAICSWLSNGPTYKAQLLVAEGAVVLVVLTIASCHARWYDKAGCRVILPCREQCGRSCNITL